MEQNMSNQPKPTTGEQRCAGPRQHGHPLVYESHCEHGETKPHIITPTTGEWTVEPCIGSISGEEWPGLSYIRVGSHTMGSVNTEVGKAIVSAHNAAVKEAYQKGYEDGKQAR